jgi:hypothetical protein
VYTGFWCGNLSVIDNFGNIFVKARLILRWIISKIDVGLWIGSRWLKRAISVGYIKMR